jgi:hypothetical protein
LGHAVTSRERAKNSRDPAGEFFGAYAEVSIGMKHSSVFSFPVFSP